jgi:HK97 family phage major capsid protein
MSQNLIELRNQKTKLLLDAQKILTKQGVSAEERSTAQKMIADVELIEQNIALEERIAKDTAERAEQEQRAGRPPRGPIVSNDEKVEAEKRAMRDFIVHGKQTEQRDLGVGAVAGSITGGSQLVAPAFSPILTQAMQAYGGVVNIVNQRQTDTGASMKISFVNDTGNGLTTWGEDTAAAEADPLLSTATSNTDKYTTGVILVTLEELEDSYFDLDAFIRDSFGQRLYRGLAKNISQGSGNFASYFAGATSGATTSTAGGLVITYLDLLNLYNSIDPAYLGTSTWTLSSASRGVLLSLLDSTGRPLFQPALSAPNGADALGTLLGRPVVLDQFAPTIAAGHTPIAFGDFKQGVTLRTVGQFQIARDPFTYLASKGAIGFIGYGRGGSFLTDAGTHPIKTLLMHA